MTVNGTSAASRIVSHETDTKYAVTKVMTQVTSAVDGTTAVAREVTSVVLILRSAVTARGSSGPTVRATSTTTLTTPWLEPGTRRFAVATDQTLTIWTTSGTIDVVGERWRLGPRGVEEPIVVRGGLDKGVGFWMVFVVSFFFWDT